jgi:PAN domain-containing protein
MRMPLPFASLLAVVLMVSPAAFAQTYEPGIDRPGGDYRSFDLGAPNAAQCAAACMADGQCAAYTYVNPGVQSANARCWLKNAIPSPVANPCCTSGLKVAAAPIPMPVPAPTARVFPYPSVSGMRVDRCLYWAQQCDQPAATRFCQSQGMSVAINWAWEHVTPTYVLGDGRVCQAPNNCGGFSTITCQ